MKLSILRVSLHVGPLPTIFQWKCTFHLLEFGKQAACMNNPISTNPQYTHHQYHKVKCLHFISSFTYDNVLNIILNPQIYFQDSMKHRKTCTQEQASPHLVTFLTRSHMSQWQYVVSCDSKKKYQKDMCLIRVTLHAQFMSTTLRQYNSGKRT